MDGGVEIRVKVRPLLVIRLDLGPSRAAAIPIKERRDRFSHREVRPVARPSWPCRVILHG